MKNSLLIIYLWITAFYGFAQEQTLQEPYEDYLVDLVETPEGTVPPKNSRQSFSCKLKTLDETIPQLLIVQYSGSNRPEKDEKILFRILMNNTLIYTEGLNRNRRGLFEVTYRIPPDALKGDPLKEIRFEPYDEKTVVGEIYAVAVVKQKTETGSFDDLKNWQGLSSERTFRASETIIYTEPDGPDHASVIDLPSFYALRLTLKLKDIEQLPVQVFVSDKRIKHGSEITASFDTRKAVFTIQQQDNQTGELLIPCSEFDSPAASNGTLRSIKSIVLQFNGDAKGQVELLSANLINGLSVSAHTEIKSKAGKADETITYPVYVTNTEKSKQTIHFSIQKYGWESMPASVEPQQIELAPNETGKITLKVTIPEKTPPGGREKQTVRIRPSANPSATQVLTFTTLREMEHPFTIHTHQGWNGVREKAGKYDWASDRKVRYLRDADQWEPPVRQPYITNVDGIPHLCKTTNEIGLMDNAIAWQLSREKKYAEKVRRFLLMVSDYNTGFPLTRKASDQASVQEGHFFQHLAQAYDLIIDAGILTAEERTQIKHTFRLYVNQELYRKSPGGANWAISQLTGAFFCALVLQDFDKVDEALYAPSCLIDKFRTYTMPDGWWYECTVSYNLWVAGQFIQIGLALEPFGYSILTEKFQADYNLQPEYEKTGDNEIRDQRNVHHGHSFRIRGPIRQPYVTIKMMSDALLPFLDYRGWIFGINDATEREVGGSSFELAYHAFRDPRYAEFIRLVRKRTDLIYGVPELPESAGINEIKGAYADNAGALLLRSTQKDPREKIQAVLKYGTHGGYHGHFDRTGLLSLMRYGRSFYNPEMVWYSYAPFMYNFYVQTSVSKNMVTVDLKQQEADESERTLFYTGDLFQAGCVEGTAAWSYPAYGGLRASMKGPRDFKEKTVVEERYMPSPENHPPFGVLTGFTEAVFQRRLMVVTDDYVVIADYNKSTENKQHTFDQLFQIKGLLGLTADEKELTAHTGQLDNDPLGAAQLVTDVNRYTVTGTLKAEFLTKFGPDADNRGTRIYGEPGNLFMNVYYAYPNNKREAFTGKAPEDHGVQRTLEYEVRGDERVLAEGTFGAWILGEGKVDVDVTGISNLTLSSAIKDRSSRLHTLFWGEAVIETKDGKKINLSDVPYSVKNVTENPYGLTKDFEDGRINISGNNYAWGLSGEPEETGPDHPAEYTFNLTGLDAVRLKTTVGGDYPVGNEAERRMTIGVRTKSAQAQFLTVIEPFEKESVIESVIAPSADMVEISLKDGRKHMLFLSGMEESNEHTLAVKIQEWKNGKMIKEENSKKN